MPVQAERRNKMVSVRVPPATRRRLGALAVLRGVTASDVLRGLIDAAPLEPEKHNGGAAVIEAERAAVV
jgi:hypothetical protein